MNWQSILDAFAHVDLRNALLQIRSVIASPQSNLTLAFALLALLALMALVVIMALLFLSTPKQRKMLRTRRYRAGAPAEDGSRPAEEHTSPAPMEDPASAVRRAERAERDRRVLQTVGSPWMLTLLAALAFGLTYVSTSTDGFCARTCHADSDVVAHAVESRHAACVTCHEEPGLTGIAPNVLGRVRMGVAYVRGGMRAAPGDTPVDEGACVSCHRRDLSGVIATKQGIRVSHKEFVEAGAACSSCHEAAGHSDRRYAGGMSRCVVCHDSVKASAECSSCHETDPLAAAMALASGGSTETIGSGRIIYPAVRAAKRECGGCHDLPRTCDPCHNGIRMPHSTQFTSGGGHAPYAAFERRKVCWKCHEVNQCNTKCHTALGKDQVAGHVPDWKEQHKLARWDDPCSCHAVRTHRTFPMCVLCHGTRR